MKMERVESLERLLFPESLVLEDTPDQKGSPELME